MRSSMVARVSRWTADRAMVFDVAFALVVGTMSLAGHLTAAVDASERESDPLAIALIVAGTALFALRRRVPLLSLAGITATTVVFWVRDYASDFHIFATLAVYAAVAHGGSDRRRVWGVAGGAVLVLSGTTLAGLLSPEEDLPAQVVFAVTIVNLTAAITGELVHGRRRRVALLEERAERAEAERELLAREAVLAERGRIARDLHDIVAHAMSMMVVQAGAAERIVTRHPDRAANALGDIQSTGRQALDEMRRMVGVLRDGDDPALAPQPTLDDIATLVQHCSDAGVPTELIIEGERTERRPALEMTGYRIVQEALTNVVKHAGRPANAAVRVFHGHDRLRLEVVDDGVGASGDGSGATSGHGLVGMRERIEMYRGTLVAGPLPGGGFRVAADLPLDTPLSMPAGTGSVP